MSALTATSVTQDLQQGIIDRFRSVDVGGAAVLAGDVTASAVRNLVSTVVVVAVALLIGFRPTASAVEWLGAAAVLLAFVLAVSWLSA